MSWANVGPAMPALGALGRRCPSVATRTGANMPRSSIGSDNVLPNRHMDPEHGWKAMNKVYNVSSEATSLPTNNTDIM